MRKLITTLFVPIFFMCVLVFDTHAQDEDQQQFKVAGADSILIKDWDVYASDRAALITDPNVISEFVRLLDGNAKVTENRCGYDWELIFRKGRANTKTIYFNAKCDKAFMRDTDAILKLFNSYFELIKTKPSFFITNIELPVTVERMAALKKLEDKNNKVFFLNDLGEKFPSVRLMKEVEGRYSEEKEKQAIAEIEKTVASFKSTYSVLRHTEPEYSSVVDEGTGVKTTIYFQLGTKLADVGKQVDNIKVLELREPKTYFIQLVTPQRCTKETARELKDKHQFIVNAFPYPKRSEETAPGAKNAK